MFGLNSQEEFIYIRLANYILVFSVFLLWIGFILVGIIARRFEKVLKVPTRWVFLMIAPTGLFVYGILAFYSIVMQEKVKMPLDISFIAYIFFSLAALLTFVAFRQFYNVIKRGGR